MSESYQISEYDQLYSILLNTCKTSKDCIYLAKLIQATHSSDTLFDMTRITSPSLNKLISNLSSEYDNPIDFYYKNVSKTTCNEDRGNFKLKPNTDDLLRLLPGLRIKTAQKLESLGYYTIYELISSTRNLTSTTSLQKDEIHLLAAALNKLSQKLEKEGEINVIFNFLAIQG